MNPAFKTLKNGIRVVVLPLEERPFCNVSVFLQSDPALEPEGLTGINHFLEHMIFSGPESYTDSYTFFKDLARNKTYFNATTYKQFIEFYMRTVPEEISQALEIMAQSIKTPRLTEKEVIKTKQVVKEEIQSGKNNKGEWINRWTLSDSIFWEGPAANPVLGEEDTVENISLKDLKNQHKKLLTGSNILVFIAGDVAPSSVFETAKRHFSDIKKGEKRPYAVRDIAFNEPVFSHTDDDSAQVRAALRFPLVGFEDKRFICAQVLSEIFGSSSYSRLFTKVREEKGLVYTIFSRVYLIYGESFLEVGFKTDPSSLSEVLKTIFKEIESLQDGGVTQEELELAQSEQEIDLRQTLDSIGDISDYFGLYTLFEAYEEVPERLERLKNLTRSDILDIINTLFDPALFTLVTVGSLSEQQKKKIEAFIRKKK